MQHIKIGPCHSEVSIDYHISFYNTKPWFKFFLLIYTCHLQSRAKYQSCLPKPTVKSPEFRGIFLWNFFNDASS